MVRQIARKAPGEVRFCYEAGVCGFSVQRQIQAAGAPCVVVAIADQAMVRLHDRCWRLVRRSKLPTKAVTAVARELAGFLWAVLSQQGRAPTVAEACLPSRAVRPEGIEVNQTVR